MILKAEDTPDLGRIVVVKSHLLHSHARLARWEIVQFLARDKGAVVSAVGQIDDMACNPNLDESRVADKESVSPASMPRVDKHCAPGQDENLGALPEMGNDAFELVEEAVDHGEPAGKKGYVTPTGREGADDVDDMAEGVDEGYCSLKWGGKEGTVRGIHDAK